MSESILTVIKDFLPVVTAIVPVMTAIIGGLWIVFTYIENQKVAEQNRITAQEKERKLRVIEARKPFLDRQFALYLRISELVSMLLSTPTLGDDFKVSTDFKKIAREIEGISSGDVYMLGDLEVIQRAGELAGAVRAVLGSPNPDATSDMEIKGRELVTAMGKSIRDSWST